MIRFSQAETSAHGRMEWKEESDQGDPAVPLVELVHPHSTPGISAGTSPRVISKGVRGSDDSSLSNAFHILPSITVFRPKQLRVHDAGASRAAEFAGGNCAG